MMKIYLKLEPPYEWVRVSAKSVTAFGEVPSLDDYPIGEEDVIGVVPGEWVTNHRVDLPAKTRKQFNAALPYSLEESISEEVENMHFVCPNWKAGEESNVSVVAKSKMLEWQQLATEHRLPIKQLVPDHALVPFHEAADCSIALIDKQLLAHHRNGESVSIDEDFIDIWLMNIPTNDVIAVNDEALTETLISANPDRDVRFWGFGNKLAHWLEYEQTLPLDLWSDAYRPRVSRMSKKAFVLPVMLLAASIVLKLSYDSYRYFALHAEIVEVQDEAQEILKTRFPTFTNVARGLERDMMERAVARRGGPDKSKSVHNTLAHVSAILARQRVTLSDINYRDNELIITCLLSNFSQVDLLTKQFNQRPNLNAELQSSASEDGKVVASYRIKQK